MRDYDELIGRLRYCADRPICFSTQCDYRQTAHIGACFDSLKHDAADAIEELLAAVRSVVHCKDCEWWTKQNASIQGRCAMLAIYLTGEFYCAAGSKAEPPKEVLPNGEV